MLRVPFLILTAVSFLSTIAEATPRWRGGALDFFYAGPLFANDGQQGFYVRGQRADESQALFHLLPDGQLDSTFGEVDLPDLVINSYHLHRTPKGILYAGSENGAVRTQITRLKFDGTPDLAFAAEGTL